MKAPFLATLLLTVIAPLPLINAQEQADKPAPAAAKIDASLAMFMSLLNIGKYGEKDTEILKIKGITSSDMGGGSKFIVSNKEETLKGTTFNSGSTNGIMTNVMISIEGAEFAPEIKAELERIYTMKFPKPETSEIKSIGKAERFTTVVKGIKIGMTVHTGNHPSISVTMKKNPAAPSK